MTVFFLGSRRVAPTAGVTHAVLTDPIASIYKPGQPRVRKAGNGGCALQSNDATTDDQTYRPENSIRPG
ncbi:MAG: hypothetical protein LUG27_05405 [Clostridiales bacterium]|nr:hypothetical protein [Clostridiales bacterium]